MSAAKLALETLLGQRWISLTAPGCLCDFVDAGIGLLKVAEDPDCPNCTLPGFADWLVTNGTAPEKETAQAYLREWEAEMSAQAMAEARIQAETEAGHLIDHQRAQ